jgi:hypothetical protein
MNNKVREVYEARERRIVRAIGYLKSSTSYLRVRSDERTEDGSRWKLLDVPMNVSYQTLVDAALQAALDVLRELPDDFFAMTEARGFMDGSPFSYSQADDPLEAAKKIVAYINERRERDKILIRIRALENTTGRTPEEAESYLTMAAKLRVQHGMEKETT